MNSYKDRLQFINFFVFLIACTFIMSFLKLIYSDPRPFMSDGSIKLYECSIEYGNPSGHSFLNCFYYLTFPWMYDPDYMKFIENKKINFKKLFILLLDIIWICSIAYSRVYLGVHSLNQVFLGLVYGIFAFIVLTQFGFNFMR